MVRDHEIVACECVVHAETKDHANWQLLSAYGQAAKSEEKKAVEAATAEIEDEEDEHLYHSKGWCRELAIAALGLVSQRFEVDFLPSLVVVACCQLSVSGRALRVVLAIGILYSMAVSLALGIQGPYDGFVQAHPAAYTQLASWFSPSERFRPLLNPRLSMKASYEFPAPAPPGPLPLIAAAARVCPDATIHVTPPSKTSHAVIMARGRVLDGSRLDVDRIVILTGYVRVR